VDFRATGFDEVFGGEIERVNPAVDPATGQVRVYVDVPNADGRLISGLYAEGRVTTERATGPAAPTAALDAGTSPPTVMKVVDGKVARAPVEIALQDELAEAVVFRSGVKVGEVLVLGSARASLADGAAVELPAAPERSARRTPEGKHD